MTTSTSQKFENMAKGRFRSFRKAKFLTLPRPAQGRNGPIKLIPKPFGKSGSVGGYNLKNAMQLQNDSAAFNRALKLMHGLATKHLDKTETITRQNILNLETVFLHASEHPDGVVFRRYTDAWPMRAILQKYLLGTSGRARKGIHAGDKVLTNGASVFVSVDGNDRMDASIKLSDGTREGEDESVKEDEGQEESANMQQANISRTRRPLSMSVDTVPNSSNNSPPILGKPPADILVQAYEMSNNGIESHSSAQSSSLHGAKLTPLKESGENAPSNPDQISSISSSRPASSIPDSFFLPDTPEIGQLFHVHSTSKEVAQNYELLPSKCPISGCFDQVPRAPSLRLIETFEDMVESDYSNREKFEQKICQMIKYENDRIIFVGKAARKNWRTEFNWFEVANRVIRSQDDLWAVILDGDVKSANPFWIQLQAKYNLEELGLRPELVVAAMGRIESGYYGPKGKEVVKSTLLRLVSAIHIAQDKIEPLSPSIFVELVLVPQAIAMLIADDLGINVSEGSHVMSESASIGIALQSIETGYNDPNLDLIFKHNHLVTRRYNDWLERKPTDIVERAALEKDTDTVPVRARKRRRLASPSFLEDSIPTPAFEGG